MWILIFTVLNTLMHRDRIHFDYFYSLSVPYQIATVVTLFIIVFFSAWYLYTMSKIKEEQDKDEE